VTILWVAIGSGLGGAGRYWIFELMARYISGPFPWGTLIVNVMGSLLIGVFATLTGPEGRLVLGGTARQFVMLGILGGFTTFSAFSLQTLGLIQEGDWLPAVVNIVASVFLCLIGVWVGHTLAEAINR
jgi:CrcB protein